MNQRQAKRVACAAVASLLHNRDWDREDTEEWTEEDWERFERAVDSLVGELLSRSGCSETKTSLRAIWAEVRDGL